MAAMSVNLSAHYEAALNNSINEAREEHRKFTEAVLDALPVSLYVVDRDYRIVTWNRHREIGVQGMPRDVAIGRDVFDVLEKYPQGRLRQEFERAFRTGKIERIEQQTVADDGSTKHWMVSKVPMKDADTGEVTHVITVGEDVTVRVEAIHAIEPRRKARRRRPARRRRRSRDQQPARDDRRLCRSARAADRRRGVRGVRRPRTI